MRKLPAKTPFLLLTNPLAENMLSDENYINAVLKFIVSASDKDYENQLTKLLNRKRFASVFNAYSTTIEKFGSNKFVRTNYSLGRIWSLFKCILLKNSESITEFVRIRENFEKSTIIGDYLIAESELECAKNKFGESIWYIRNKIILLSYQGRNEDLQAFCSKYKDRSSEKLFRYIINCFQLITDSDDASLRLKSLVQSYVDEFSEGKQTSAASLLGLLFIPSPLKGHEPYIDSLESIQIFPIFDQYSILLQWLEYAVVESISKGNYLFPEIGDVINKLGEKIDDPVLKNMKRSLEGDAGSHLSLIGKSIFDSYNSGDYQNTLKIFNENIKIISNPLAFVNLVAKANAYLNNSGDDGLPKSILHSLINDLSVIYKLAPGRKQAEESIISKIIKFRGFSCFSQMQLCYYKVVPLQHSKDDLGKAGALALISHVETTPFVSSLSNCKFEEFGARYGNDVDSSPIYRKIKRNICANIKNNGSDVEIENMLDELGKFSPLKKDFLELYSEYCLYSGKIDKLLSLCANTLTNDPNAYICFPMEKLLEEIERRNIASVEAVVVAYYYLRNISSKKEYVLNEAFEEYVISKNAKKPSEILINIFLLSSLQVIFYKDICAPEVMDFLNCFKNTNELRAERVRILDLLLERNLIDADERMREVEKIVGQVIVDAGTSEFNRAKIFVDEIAIFKQYDDELKATFFVYQLAKDEGDDRITSLNEADFVGDRNAYVSGGKNSLVIRMYNLLLRGFLYDEMHGFDKNLSTEIRHGFFSNLMRARLQERNLITEIDETGKYKPNVFWENLNSFMATSTWNEISLHLNVFSSAFNNLINEAEEWMKIGGTTNSERMFNYSFSISKFYSLKSMMNEAESVEDVASFIIGNLWNDTEIALTKIRERINVDLRDRVDALFETLISNIVETKRSAAAVSLMTALNQARSEIKEDIATVAEWFKRDKSSGMEGRLLNHVIEIAINSFEKVKGSGFAIEKNISDDLRTLKISSKSVKSFIIAVTNLLDNCYRRSGLGQGTRVGITAQLTDRGAIITITNNVSIEKSKVLSDVVISEIDMKMRSPDSIDFMRTEGGSGISKAYNEIASLSSLSDLQIKYNERNFSAIITYEN